MDAIFEHTLPNAQSITESLYGTASSISPIRWIVTSFPVPSGALVRVNCSLRVLIYRGFLDYYGKRYDTGWNMTSGSGTSALHASGMGAALCPMWYADDCTLRGDSRSSNASSSEIMPTLWAFVILPV